jgi:phosphatidylserine/phosphatidylglycerophosphate/cardiolipin synthase-like enzyme
MKPVYKVLAVLLIAFLVITTLYVTVRPSQNMWIEPLFSPDSEKEIITLIGSARKSIHVEMFEFSYKPLADALTRAKQQGVRVKVLLEPNVRQNWYTYDVLKNSSIEVRYYHQGTLHSKFMVIDGTIVLTGSLNWSRNSLKNNRESGVIIYSTEIAREFEKVFEHDWR